MTQASRFSNSAILHSLLAHAVPSSTCFGTDRLCAKARPGFGSQLIADVAVGPRLAVDDTAHTDRTTVRPSVARCIREQKEEPFRGARLVRLGRWELATSSG